MLNSEDNEKFHFGISIGGACNTTFPSKGAWTFNNNQTKLGFSGGASFECDFAKRFFAYFEASVSTRHLLANGFSTDTALGNFDLAYQYTNINVPIGIGMSLFPVSEPFNVSLIAGAVVGLPQINKSTLTVNMQDVNGQTAPMNTINLGAMAEVRVKYNFVFLSLRYEFSGTDVFNYREQAFKTGTFSFLFGFQII